MEDDNLLKDSSKIKHIIWYSIIIDILILDQITKWLVTETIFRPKTLSKPGLDLIEWYTNTPAMLPHAHIEMTSFFNLVMAWNTGVSFSMFSDYGPHMPNILIGVALVITGLFLIWLVREDRHLYGISYALIIGGALGNVIDRARFGAVIDFLDFHLFGYHWPAFNVADMAVVCGISMLIIVSLFFDIPDKEGYRNPEKRTNI